MVKNIIEMSLLYDFYGELLTDRQKNVMQYYYGDDLSLAEIAAEAGTSRQAVYDTVRKAERSLREHEEKLGLVSRFMKTGSELASASGMLDGILEEYRDDSGLCERIAAVKDIIDSIEEEL